MRTVPMTKSEKSMNTSSLTTAGNYTAMTISQPIE